MTTEEKETIICKSIFMCLEKSQAERRQFAFVFFVIAKEVW